jgi:hypothetical protein
LHGSVGGAQILLVNLGRDETCNADALSRRRLTDESAYFCAVITMMLFANEDKMTVWVVGQTALLPCMQQTVIQLDLFGVAE